MIAAEATGRPSLKRGPARSPKPARFGALGAGAIAVGAALLAIAPLASLAVLAFGATASSAAPTAIAPAPSAPKRTRFGERAGPRCSEGRPVTCAAIMGLTSAANSVRSLSPLGRGLG